jgi:hypothetical protein
LIRKFSEATLLPIRINKSPKFIFHRHICYIPLNASQNEIRLLSLLPDDGVHGVSCTLEHASLINPPKYVALSYCWGEPTCTKKISINGNAVNVTSNLESALRHLRAKGYRRLWIDAVCINQRDKIEKSQQLLWMGSIYRRAEEVAAWTGEDSADLHKALSFVKSSRYILHVEDTSNHFGKASHLPESTADGHKEHSTNDHLDKLVAFWDFLERPYWRRVWVIQELALAKHATVHWGHHTITWIELKSVLEKCRTAFNSSLTSQYKPTQGFVNAKSLSHFHTDIANGKPLRLLEALQRSLGSLSTEPRDKVFALLGLVHDGGIFIPVPNYEQSVESICMSMTISAVSSTSSLDIVPMLGSGPANRLGLPSWVPNWFELDESSAYRQLNYLLRSKARSLYSSPFDGFLYSAGAGSPVVTIDGRILRAKGFIFGVVDGLSHTVSETGSPPTALSKLPSAVGRNPYGTDHELLDAITRALTRHTKQGILRRRDVALNLIFDFWAQHPRLVSFTGEVRAWLLAMKSFSVGSSTLEDFASKLLPAPRELTIAANTEDDWLPWAGDVSVGQQRSLQIIQWRVDNLYQLLLAVEETLKDGMRFMTTDHGYVGWAHHQAKKGDHIFILQGCSVPVLLRPRTQGGYVIVGDSYVEGIMMGQAAIGLQDSDWHELDIH